MRVEEATTTTNFFVQLKQSPNYFVQVVHHRASGGTEFSPDPLNEVVLAVRQGWQRMTLLPSPKSTRTCTFPLGGRIQCTSPGTSAEAAACVLAEAAACVPAEAADTVTGAAGAGELELELELEEEEEDEEGSPSSLR